MEPRQGTAQARHLRKTATDAEKLLWKYLRAGRLCGFKFRRQVPISGFVVDLVCLPALLIVEVDGSQHAECVVRDDRRSEILAKSGFRIVRFWNNEVLQSTDDVLAEILRHLEVPPSPHPSPASGRGG